MLNGRMAKNDEVPAAERPCDACGSHFESGTFLICDGRAVSILCSACYRVEVDSPIVREFE
jgi:hypothetical protein